MENIGIFIIIAIVSLAFCVLIGEVSYIIYKAIDKIEERKEKENRLSVEITDDKLNILDKIIDIEFENYIKTHPDLFDMNGNSYIKDSQFRKIIVEITDAVAVRLTPTIMEIVQLTYKLDYQQTVILVGKKVGLNIAIAAAEINNTLLDEDSTTINI